MKIRNIITSGLVAITLLGPAAGDAQDISWKIQEDLFHAMNTEKYIRYPGTDLVDALIMYNQRFSADDWLALGMDAKREVRDQKTIRVGMKKEKIMEYAKRANVKLIVPNHYGEGIK